MYGTNGDGRDETDGQKILIDESQKRFGKAHTSGWIMMNYWDGNVFHLRLFLVMLTVDVIMVVSFTIAATLGSLTFYYIQRAKMISMQSRNQQLKLFIAVCAQTLVPLVFVYIPYFCVINFAFFRLPVFSLDDAFMLMTSCFPAWDAVVIIVLMKDYREGLLDVLRKKKLSQKVSLWKTTTSTVLTLSTALPTSRL